MGLRFDYTTTLRWRNLWADMTKRRHLNTYCQGLIESFQQSAKLVIAPFHSKLPRDKDFKDHWLLPGDFVYWKEHQIKHTLQPHWKGCYYSSKCKWKSTPVYEHQRLLEKEMPPTSELESNLKIDKVCIPMDWCWTQNLFCLIVFTCLIIILVIIVVIFALWVFLYSPSLYDYWPYVR